jgi:hypothetical protein
VPPGLKEEEIRAKNKDDCRRKHGQKILLATLMSAKESWPRMMI